MIWPTCGQRQRCDRLICGLGGVMVALTGLSHFDDSLGVILPPLTWSTT